jgi:hypothetical protein
MPQSTRTIAIKHCAAMHLILAMQDPTTGENINVKYVAENDATSRMTPPADIDGLRAGLEAMQDLLMLVDEGIYTAFHGILNTQFSVAGQSLTPDIVSSSASSFSLVLRAVTEQTNNAMSCDGSLHPSTFIMREVVAAMLA